MGYIVYILLISVKRLGLKMERTSHEIGSSISQGITIIKFIERPH